MSQKFVEFKTVKKIDKYITIVQCILRVIKIAVVIKKLNKSN